ncbi:glycosyltransferase family 2 protein [Thalassotalea agarivorans]|nr:glycosyltransferase family 2 protein [Thalassotalea agarivorans]
MNRINQSFAERQKPLPGVSILIPAYNEQVGIVSTIKSVLATGYPNLQIVIIDDGSTDNTNALVTSFIEKQASEVQQNITLLSIENGGKANALNHGLKHANKELVMTVDADCLVEKNAILHTVKQFNCPLVGAVAGNVVIGNKNKFIELVQQLEYLCGFFFRRSDAVFNSVMIIGGAAATYRRDVLNQVGGFDCDTVTEDIEIALRILGHGYKTRYASDAITYTEGPNDLRSWCKQRLRWKFGRFQALLKYRHLFFSTKATYSNYLTFLTLPAAIYAEFILLLQPLLLLCFFGFAFATNVYAPIAVAMTISMCIISMQVLLDPKPKYHSNLLLLAPIAWCLFYIVEMIEYQALIRSLKRLVKKQSLQWQHWVRIGIK